MLYYTLEYHYFALCQGGLKRVKMSLIMEVPLFYRINYLKNEPLSELIFIFIHLVYAYLSDYILLK